MKWHKMDMYYNKHTYYLYNNNNKNLHTTISPIEFHGICLFLALIAVSAMFRGIWAYTFDKPNN